MPIFATTANKNAQIETYVRGKDIECRSQGLFQIDIFSWEDIVDQLERYRETYNWYVNNCQFKDATNVKISFNGNEVTTIYPEFVKTTIRYEYKQLSEFEKTIGFNLENLRLVCTPFVNP